MICRNCLRAASRARFLPQARSFAVSTAPSAAAAAATSTSAAQPLSAPRTPAPSSELKTQAAEVAAARKKAAPSSSSSSGAVVVKSSVPAGTPLKGLNFEKNKQDPVALGDEEYPGWLWTVLAPKEGKGEGGAAAGDLFSKSKKQRRLAAKRLRREQAMNPDALVPKVPLYEQTIDLPAGDGSLEGAVKAADSRGELTKAMRGKRRAGIKERNFLQAMG